MTGEARAGVGIDGSGAGQMHAEQFFASSVGLTFDIDHGDDRALHVLVATFIDHAAHSARHQPALLQTDDIVARTREAILCIRHDGGEARGFAIESTVAGANRA